MSSPAEVLTCKIRQAFAGNEYPGDDLLTVYDIEAHDIDRTFQLLCGKTWHDFPIAEFLCGDTPVPDLTAEAFHYFLPGFLIASLDENDFAVEVADTLLFYLSPQSAQQVGEFTYDNTARFASFLQLLTDRQRKVTINVLREYVARGWATHDEIRDSIACLQSTQGRI